MADFDCCVGTGDVVSPALGKMVISDWYDGPSTGILICDRCMRAYHFVLVDWDRSHSRRVFVLQRLPDDTVSLLSRLVGESPVWPLWFPNKFKHPADADQPILDAWQDVIESAEAPCAAILWDVKSWKAILARRIEHQSANYAQYLLDQDSTTASVDWFVYLGVSR